MPEITMPEIKEMVQQIAQFMPDWAYKDSPYDWSETMTYTGPDERYQGAGIFFRRGQASYSTVHKARLEVSGIWPKRFSGEMVLPSERKSISVGVSRGAEAIAGDIIRRFLPTYLEQYANMREIAITAKENHDRAISVMNDLVGEGNTRSNSTDIEGFLYPDTGSIYVRTSDGLTVMIKLSGIPPALAKQVVSLVMGDEREPNETDGEASTQKLIGRVETWFEETK